MWKAKPFTNTDKRIHITGPGDIELFVDFDDVNHGNIREMVKRTLATLNGHFEADHGRVTFQPNTGKIKFMRDVVDEFVRACYKVKPPSLKEHRGRPFEQFVSDSVDEILASPHDTRAVEIIMLKLDTDELPGKVNAWRKVLRGDC